MKLGRELVGFINEFNVDLIYVVVYSMGGFVMWVVFDVGCDKIECVVMIGIFNCGFFLFV